MEFGVRVGVWSLGLRVWGLGFRILCSAPFRVWGLGYEPKPYNETLNQAATATIAIPASVELQLGKEVPLWDWCRVQGTL